MLVVDVVDVLCLSLLGKVGDGIEAAPFIDALPQLAGIC